MGQRTIDALDTAIDDMGIDIEGNYIGPKAADPDPTPQILVTREKPLYLRKKPRRIRRPR